MAPQVNNIVNLNNDNVSAAILSTTMASSTTPPLPPIATTTSSFLNLPSTYTQTSNSPLTLAPQFLAGVIPLADLSTISTRTTLTGTTTYLDALIICPGIHKQQSADAAAGNVEFPATAAMTTGYVFRTENQATVRFLQHVGVVGGLVTVTVSPMEDEESWSGSWKHVVRNLGLRHWKTRRRENGWSVAYLTCPILTLSTMVFVTLIQDWWALSVLMLLILARTINIIIFRRRAVEGWHGVKEPGVKGDLLVLMSRDRWFRIRGLVDDLKAVTSGSWLRSMGTLEGIAVAGATTMVYLAGALAVCSSLVGSLVLSVLLMVSVALLGLSNSQLQTMRMHGRTLKVEGEPRLYRRRLDMAKEMIREHGGDDHWAIALGMIVPDRDRLEKATM